MQRFDPELFLEAQQPHLRQALGELHAGKKSSHWMWYIFPQLAGLGTSEMSKKYGIRSAEQAKDYTWDPALKNNLSLCLDALLTPANARRDASAIFGKHDAQKLHASLTLFNMCSPEQDIIDKTRQALRRFFDGEFHSETARRLRSPRP